MRIYDAICALIEAKAVSLACECEPQKEGATSTAEAYRMGFHAYPEMRIGAERRGND
ncbi:hypothetical protein HD598_002147 [Neomicrococcus aestuarii]|uniref:Uncharacterized protein n=1 Tax=Neomicrococcus aestuarii TaxID=556325 RepID=A0A7W8TWJ8_9MICC|nr:hypothetical protein [Neomicrococcus aestuarii]